MNKRKLVMVALIFFTAVGCNEKASTVSNVQTVKEQSPKLEDEKGNSTNVTFGQLNTVFKFSADIPSTWNIQYVPEIQSVNIYDTAKAGADPLEKSVIFIRYFSANKFLTLNTVDVLDRKDDEVQGRPAVRYEIKKKTSVPDFFKQPGWRNQQHKLVDVRYGPENPSLFYVFAYNPDLPEEDFEKFLESLRFSQ